MFSSHPYKKILLGMEIIILK